MPGMMIPSLSCKERHITRLLNGKKWGATCFVLGSRCVKDVGRLPVVRDVGWWISIPPIPMSLFRLRRSANPANPNRLIPYAVC